jgi:formate C-acetyltransferase
MWNSEEPKQLDVRDFIQKNYTPFEGDKNFLQPITPRTETLWKQVLKLLEAERDKGGPLDFDADTPAGITSHGAGYIDKDIEIIVGLQTDAPLKRAIVPYGGIRMVQTSCDTYGKTLNPSSVFPLKDAMVNRLHQVSYFSGHHAHILAFSK